MVRFIIYLNEIDNIFEYMKNLENRKNGAIYNQNVYKYI